MFQPAFADVCKKLLTMVADEGTQKWGPELRAEPRGSTMASSPYLWQGGSSGGDKQPANQSTFNANNCVGDKDINVELKEDGKRTELLASLFQNPKLITSQ